MRSVSLPTSYHQNRSFRSIALFRRRSSRDGRGGLELLARLIPVDAAARPLAVFVGVRAMVSHLGSSRNGSRMTACNVNCPRGDPPVGPLFCHRPASAPAQEKAYVTCISFYVIAYNRGKIGWFGCRRGATVRRRLRQSAEGPVLRPWEGPTEPPGTNPDKDALSGDAVSGPVVQSANPSLDRRGTSDSIRQRPLIAIGAAGRYDGTVGARLLPPARPRSCKDPDIPGDNHVPKPPP